MTREICKEDRPLIDHHWFQLPSIWVPQIVEYHHPTCTRCNNILRTELVYPKRYLHDLGVNRHLLNHVLPDWDTQVSMARTVLAEQEVTSPNVIAVQTDVVLPRVVGQAKPTKMSKLEVRKAKYAVGIAAYKARFIARHTEIIRLLNCRSTASFDDVFLRDYNNPIRIAVFSPEGVAVEVYSGFFYKSSRRQHMNTHAYAHIYVPRNVQVSVTQRAVADALRLEDKFSSSADVCNWLDKNQFITGPWSVVYNNPQLIGCFKWIRAAFAKGI